MGNKKKDSAPQEAMKRQKVETELVMVPISDIVTNHGEYGYRDEGDYDSDNKVVKEMADSIDLEGLRIPLEGFRTESGKVCLTEGQTREASLRLLVRNNPAKYGPDYLVPVFIEKTEIDEMERILRLGTPNLSRRPWPETGMIRWCVKVSSFGCPTGEIARVLGKSTKQVERYLLLGHCPEMQELVKSHYVTATTATKLLEVCKEDKHRTMLIAKVTGWGLKKAAEIKDKNLELAASDKDELTGKDAWPATYLKPEQIKAWKQGAKTGTWKDPSFTFVAGIATDPKTKRRKVVVDSLNKNVDELSPQDFAKLVKRFTVAAQQAFDEIPAAKRRQAEKGDVDANSGSAKEAIARLKAAGFGDLLDDDDDDEVDGEKAAGFNLSAKREEQDISGTIKFPGDEDEDSSELDEAGDEDDDDSELEDDGGDINEDADE